MGKAYCKRTPSFFAEFLNEGSPVHLGLLAQSTCVGFSTVMNARTLEVFPGTLLFFVHPNKSGRSEISWENVGRIYLPNALNISTQIQ